MPSALLKKQVSGSSVMNKHIVMSSGRRIITIPQRNPVNAVTMVGIVHDAGLTVDEFRALL